MWKKIVVAIIALIGTVSIGYNLKTNLYASNTPDFKVKDSVVIGGLTFYVTDIDEVNQKIHFMTARLTGYSVYSQSSLESTVAMFNINSTTDTKGAYIKEIYPNLTPHAPTANDLVRLKKNDITDIMNSDYIWANIDSCNAPQFDNSPSGALYEPPYKCGFDKSNNNSHGSSISYYNTSHPWTLGYAVAFEIDLKSVQFEHAYVSGTAYVYDENVYTSDKVGSLKTKGLSASANVELQASNDAGHSNDFKNFNLVKTGNDYDLKVASDAPNSTDFNNGKKSLDSGTYKFNILAQDGANYTNSIQVTIQVEKKKTEVSFTNKSKLILKTGDPLIYETIETNVDDLGSNDATAPVYSLEDGVIGTGLTVTKNANNLKECSISIGQNANPSLPATFTLKVTIPETKNRSSATATKEILVYNSLTNLSWTPVKGSYSPSDVTSGKAVGSIEAVGGYGPYTYELVKPTDSQYDSTDGADNDKFKVSNIAIASGSQKVMTSTGLLVGDYHIQFKVTDSLHNTIYQTAVIEVVANPQAALYFKDKAGGSVITSFTLTYPDATKSLIAEGGSGTGAITYDLAPASTQPADITDAKDYLEIASNGTLKPKKPGTIIVRATKAKDTNYAPTYVDMPVTILPATQELTWSGTNVTQVSGSKDTWKLETYWSGGTDTYDIQELLNGAALTKQLGISTNVLQATTNVAFTFSLNVSNADKSLVSLSSNTLTIQGKPSGVIQLEAKRAGENGYGDSASAYLNITINSLPEIKFTYDVTNGCSSSMAAASTCTLSGEKLGELQLNPATSGYTQSIKSVEYDSTGTGNSYSNAPGVFALSNNKDVNITSSLNNGIYRITFAASNGTYSLTDVATTITVSNNAFHIASWTWEAGDVGVLQAINGTVDTSTNAYSSSYQRAFSPVINGVKDQLQVALKGVPAGASITYKVKDSSDPNVISHAANDIFYVDGAGGSSHTVFIEAIVSKSGYTNVSVYLPIEISKYAQSIAFANTTAIFLPNNGVCTSIPNATVTSTHSNYASPGNPIAYEADSASSNVIKINGNQVCSIAGTSSTSAKINAVLDGDTNYEKATASKNVILYAPATITVSESIQPITGGASNIVYTSGAHIVAHDSLQTKNGSANQNAVVANVKLTGMAGSASYKLSTNTNTANDDKKYFDVNPISGNITLKQDITASDLFAHQPSGNTFYIQVDVKDPHGFVQTVDVQVVIDDANAEFYFHDGGTKLPITGAGSGIYVDNLTGVAKYSEPYVPNGTLTRIETNRGDATYSVDTDALADPDVIQLASGNTYTIMNATDEQAKYGGHGGKAYAKACIPAGSGYQAQCIYAEVEITKAEQTGFSFAQDPLNLTSTSGSITPLYTNHKDGQDVLISNSSDPTIVDAGTYTQGSNQEIQIFKEGGPVTITASTEGNRNYNSATATTTVNVTAKPPTTLTVDVNPKPIYYGDSTAIAKINAGYKSGTPAYFSSSDPSIVEVSDTSTGNDTSDALIIKKVGTVDIEVCQTDQIGFQAGNPCPVGADYGYKTITIQPRAITLKIKDESIYTGEAFPSFSFEASLITGSFAGSDTITDFPLPSNTNAMDDSTIVSTSNQAGTYAIQGSYSSAEKTQSFLNNYEVTIQDGRLTVLQDSADASWFYLEGAVSGDLPLDPTKWYNEDVYVKLDASKANGIAGAYNEISDTLLFTNADKTKYLISNEDANTKDVYFRIDPNGGTSHAGAISSKQTTGIKIDKTKPKITGAKGTPSTNNLLEDILNKISFNTFFKTGVEVIISSEDPQPQGSTQTVSVSGVASIDYTIYEIDEKTGVVNANITPIKDSGTVDANGDIKFTIAKVGAYKVCAIAHDNAGNDSAKEECYYLNVKKINVDEDGDEIPDFVDSDENGCPDLNIILGEDKDGNKVKLNVAEKGKKYPYMNIDSNGDGLPDLNIDTDHDGKPDLNLIIMNESLWKPKTCVVVEKLKDYSEPIEYCTGTDAKPQINVVIDNGVEDIKDQIPSINIDNNGDMKPDINISSNGKKPEVNIVILHEWKPNSDYTKDNFFYDSIGTGKDDPKREVNIDTDNDGRPDVNIDINDDGKPDINIDMDGDEIPDIDIDTKGDGNPDTNVDTNGDGNPDENIITITEWIPNKDVDGTISYDTMEFERKSELEDNGVIVEKPDGTFLPNSAIKVNDISDHVDEEIKDKLNELAGEQEIKRVYDVEYLEGNITKQPDGNVKVKIPVDPLVKNARIVVEKEDGTFEEVTYAEKDGYYVFETEYIGKVSVIGDEEENTEPKPEPTPNPSTGDKDNPSTNVKGTYTNNTSGIGGANTGDETHLYVWFVISTLSLCITIITLRKQEKA